MIKIIKGAYGYVIHGHIQAMTKSSPPFSLTETREAELVKAGVAIKVEPSAQTEKYNSMKIAELRKAAASAGIDASKTSTAKNKKELISLLETINKDSTNTSKE